jgi:tetratricopeptide (TPR) repeat protein
MYIEAIDNYTKALTIDESDEALYYNLARAYKEVGDFNSAVKNLEKALELKSDFQEAKEYMPYLKSMTSSKKN